MSDTTCPKCGQETPNSVPCLGCGHASANGAVKPAWVKPSPPPEFAGRVFTPTPPEVLEQMRREFDEAEYLAAAREVERSGGVQIDDLIAELERRVDGIA